MLRNGMRISWFPAYFLSIMLDWLNQFDVTSNSGDADFRINKTDVGRRQTLGHPRSINPNMINDVAKQSPLISQVIYIYAVCTRSNKNFVFVSSRMSRFKKQSKVRCQQPLGCLLTWFGRLSNTAHRYRKSISIIKMYSTNNIDS